MNNARNELGRIQELAVSTNNKKLLEILEERANEYHGRIEEIHTEMYDLEICASSPEEC